MIKHTFTKTVGDRPDNYTIFSIMGVEHDDGLLHENEYFIMNVLKCYHGEITSMQQRVSIADMKELSMILWEATNNYERRQREKTKETSAKAETEN